MASSANTSDGVVLKSAGQGGYVIAKFTKGGFIKGNHVTTTIGANTTASETVSSMNILSIQVNTGGANSVYFEIKRGTTMIGAFGGTDTIDLSDGRLLDMDTATASSNVVVTKVGTGPSTLILKLHKTSAISGGSIY